MLCCLFIKNLITKKKYAEFIWKKRRSSNFNYLSAECQLHCIDQVKSLIFRFPLKCTRCVFLLDPWMCCPLHVFKHKLLYKKRRRKQMARAVQRRRKELCGFIDVRCLFAQIKLGYHCNSRVTMATAEPLCAYIEQYGGWCAATKGPIISFWLCCILCAYIQVKTINCNCADYENISGMRMRIHGEEKVSISLPH